MFKQCTKCGETKPLDTVHFYSANRKGKQRFNSECKKCTRAQQKEKYHSDAEYREQIKARQSAPEVKDRTNRRNRERYHNDEEYRQKKLTAQCTLEAREKTNRRNRERRTDDPEWNKAKNALRRERYHNKPGYKESGLLKRRERYHNDEEHRQKILTRQRLPEVRQRANQREMERRANDPEWREAENARNRDRYQNDLEHREKLLERQRSPEVRKKTNRRIRERRANNPAWRESQNAKLLEQYRNNPKRKKLVKNQRLTSLYGITIEEYTGMEAAQNGLCVICRRANKLVVDHNHKNEQVRALLCNNCNTGLGQFEEDEEILMAAVEYLRRNHMEPQSVPTIPDEQLFSRFEIPYWTEQSRDKRFRRSKDKNLKQGYNITIDQYEWMLNENNGLCWICNRPEVRKRNPRARYPDALHVDHDHESGMIRGLLCGRCNYGVGAFEDDIKRIFAAVAYLDQWNVSNTDGGWRTERLIMQSTDCAIPTSLPASSTSTSCRAVPAHGSAPRR